MTILNIKIKIKIRPRFRNFNISIIQKQAFGNRVIDFNINNNEITYMNEFFANCIYNTISNE